MSSRTSSLSILTTRPSHDLAVLDFDHRRRDRLVERDPEIVGDHLSRGVDAVLVEGARGTGLARRARGTGLARRAGNTGFVGGVRGSATGRGCCGSGVGRDGLGGDGGLLVGHGFAFGSCLSGLEVGRVVSLGKTGARRRAAGSLSARRGYHRASWRSPGTPRGPAQVASARTGRAPQTRPRRRWHPRPRASVGARGA